MSEEPIRMKRIIKLADYDNKQPRLYFQSLEKNKEEIIKIHNDHIECTNNVVIPNGFYVTEYQEPEHVIIWKKKDSKIYFLESYDIIHLRYSIIKNILLNENKDIKQRVRTCIFELYYYWFFNCNEEFNSNITKNVIIDIEDIIKFIIEKETKLYINYNTDSIINELRDRIRYENLAEQVTYKKILNFRR